jgi:hypothetical protein
MKTGWLPQPRRFREWRLLNIRKLPTKMAGKAPDGKGIPAPRNTILQPERIGDRDQYPLDIIEVQLARCEGQDPPVAN